MMSVSEPETVAEIVRVLDQSERVLICGHVRPDGDCIGSMTAMHCYLRDKGKSTR